MGAVLATISFLMREEIRNDRVDNVRLTSVIRSRDDELFGTRSATTQAELLALNPALSKAVEKSCKHCHGWWHRKSSHEGVLKRLGMVNKAQNSVLVFSRKDFPPMLSTRP